MSTNLTEVQRKRSLILIGQRISYRQAGSGWRDEGGGWQYGTIIATHKSGLGVLLATVKWNRPPREATDIAVVLLTDVVE